MSDPVKYSWLNLTTDASSGMSAIEARLGTFKKKAPLVMKAGLNEAAKEVQKRTSKHAKKYYSIKDSKFASEVTKTKLMTIKKATTSSLSATLKTSSDRMGAMYKFDVRPRQITVPKGSSLASRPARHRGKVTKGSSAKNLYADEVANTGGSTNQPAQQTRQKAFVVGFASGHTAAVYRGANKRFKDRPAGLTQEITKHNAILYEVTSPSKMSMATGSFYSEEPDDYIREVFDNTVSKKISYYLSKGSK